MRKNKIRILHVAQAAGGVDRYIRMLLKYLDKDKFENILVCSQDFHKEDYDDLVDYFEQIEMTRAIGGSDLKAIKAVRKLIRKYNPDIVYVYRTSYRLNSECKQAIQEAIADNYDGMHLDDDAVNQVVRQYGMKRVGYILANTLRYKNYDGRFSPSNKEWAEQVGTPENNARIIKFRADWVVSSHPAVLDGFVTMYREELDSKSENLVSVM